MITSNSKIQSSGNTGSSSPTIGTGTAIIAQPIIAQSPRATASAGIPLSTIQAKGDLIVGLAANLAARYPAGPDGYAIVYDSSKNLGLGYTLIPVADGSSIKLVSGKLAVGAVSSTNISTSGASGGSVLTADGSGNSYWAVPSGVATTQKVTASIAQPGNPQVGDIWIQIDSSDPDVMYLSPKVTAASGEPASPQIDDIWIELSSTTTVIHPTLIPSTTQPTNAQIDNIWIQI